MSKLWYKLRYYDPRELIAPSIYKVCGDDALNMFDISVLEFADRIRHKFGPMIANTWWNKKLIKKYGLHRFRGLRPVDCKIGAKRSAHKLGLKKPSLYSAVDLVPVECTAEEIRVSIESDIIYWNQYISRIENNVAWLHGDSKPFGAPGIRFFNP